jgi:hypothetical protein
MGKSSAVAKVAEFGTGRERDKPIIEKWATSVKVV